MVKSGGTSPNCGRRLMRRRSSSRQLKRKRRWPAVYELLHGFLGCLCKGKTAPQFVFALELKLLYELGLEPNLMETSLAAGTKKIAEVLLNHDWAGRAAFEIDGRADGRIAAVSARFFDFSSGPAAERPGGGDGGCGLNVRPECLLTRTRHGLDYRFCFEAVNHD